MELIRVERNADTYVAFDDHGEVRWTVELSLDMNGTPFREEIIWRQARVVAIGGGPRVHFLAFETGAIVKTLSLEPDLFGHFSDSCGDALYVLGWRHVFALDQDLTVQWISRDVAVDGITWRSRDGDRIFVSAEMDPPGGWVDVELDAVSGRELSREGFGR